jgi:hypothetical protein
MQVDSFLIGFKLEEVDAFLNYLLNVALFQVENERARLYLGEIQDVLDQEKHQLGAIKSCFIVNLAPLEVDIVLQELKRSNNSI